MSRCWPLHRRMQGGRDGDANAPPAIRPAPAFAYTDADGRTVSSASLAGNIYVAYFFFTSCGGPCPAMNASAAEAPGRVRGSFGFPHRRFHRGSGDRHARASRAVRRRIRRVARPLALPAHREGQRGRARVEGLSDGGRHHARDAQHALRAGGPQGHDTRLLRRARREAPRRPARRHPRAGEGGARVNASWLPPLNASLNALASLFLLAGYWFMKRKNIRMHRTMMLSAVVTSGLFLISYISYHLSTHLLTRYTGEGIERVAYFTVLISHSILAPAVPVLALITMTRGLRERIDKHRRIARWTLPVWLYVSVTGVVVYVMLYHFNT
ncbi:MAG: DUF420 domain-containing protein [Ignavibacteria bacterium]|nr:DUF420 domain-containing protein [Ignavibacteria bacterium]